MMYEILNRQGLGTVVWEPSAKDNGQAPFDRQGAVIFEKMRIYDEIVKKYTRRRR
jgi:hypothetical protein